MKKQTSIKMNFIMNAFLTLTSMIFPLITYPYISRILQPEGTGKVNFAISVIAYFTMFAQLGIPTYGIRACAQVRDNKKELSKVVEELLLINIFMCLLSYLALALGLLFVPRLREDRALFLVTGSAVFFNTIGAEWLYKGLEQYSYITIRSVIFKIIAIGAMFLAVHKQSDYVIYGGITVLASYASYLLNFFNLRKYVSAVPFKELNFRRHMKAVLAFFAMSCATTIYTNLDTVMLEFMKGDIDVGYYTTAVKVKGVLVGIVTSLGTVLLPRASYYFENKQKKEFLKIASKALRFVALAAIPMMVYFMLFARESVYLLSGPSFEGSIIPMQFIMPTLLFIGFSNIMGIQMLIPMGKEKVVLYSEIVGAAIDLIINLCLIPSFASTGAAIGTSVAEAAVTLVQYIALRKIVRKMFLSLPYLPILLGTAAGAAVSLAVRLAGFGSFLTLLLSALCFFGIYFLVLNLLKEPLICEMENQILHRKQHKSSH